MFKTFLVKLSITDRGGCWFNEKYLEDMDSLILDFTTKNNLNIIRIDYSITSTPKEDLFGNKRINDNYIGVLYYSKND
jgi:hypothetical protein